MRTVYADTVMISNTDHDTTATATVVHFIPERRLVVSHSGVEIVLNYDAKNRIYVGNAAGLEFTSQSPSEIATYRESRR